MAKVNPFATAQKQLDQCAKILHLDPGMQAALRVPSRELHVSIPVRMDDGSVKVQAPAGFPVVLAVTSQLQGETKPTLHHQREEFQFYPGEWLTLSFRREVFSNFCGGCHGPASGKEFDVSVKPDIVSQASKCMARDAPPVDGTKSPLSEIMGPPFP